MYPDTTCFYRAQVLEPPKVTQRDKVNGLRLYDLTLISNLVRSDAREWPYLQTEVRGRRKSPASGVCILGRPMADEHMIFALAT